MVQIQFVDTDVVDFLMPAYSMKPDKIIGLYDWRMVSKRRLKNLTLAIKKRLPDTVVNMVEVDRFSLTEVKEVLRREISLLTLDEIGDGLYVDISGGSEVMTACGVMICSEVKATAVYCKPAAGVIYDIASGEKVCDIVNVTLDDYLVAIGAKLTGTSQFLPKEDDYGKVLEAGKWCIEHPLEWQALSKLLMDYKDPSQGDAPLYFRIRENLKVGSRTVKTEKVTEVFRKIGYMKVESDGTYRIKNQTIRKYMTTYGLFLELYTYIKALDYFDEAYLGCTIDWDNSDCIDTNDNEIDVIAVRNSIPYFISCKMAKPQGIDLSEVAYLAKRFGGEVAKGIIVTAYDFDQQSLKNPNNIYTRCEKMFIGRVLARELAGIDGERTTKDIFDEATVWFRG